MYRILYLSILVAALMLSMPSFADEITLADGSRLVGEILKLQDGKLVFQTVYAGKLTINMAGVSGIRSDREIGIALEDGAPLYGTLEFSAGEQRLLVEEAAPEVVVLEDVRLMWVGGEKMPEITPTPILKSAPKPKKRWKGSVQFGFNGAEGNSDHVSFSGRTEGTRKTDADKLRLYAQVFYAENKGKRSRNETKAGGRYDRKLSPKWSAYTRTELEVDEFEKLDLRSTLILGASYKVLSAKNQTLSTRMGFGYLRENFERASTEQEEIIDLGYDYMVKIHDWAKLTHDLTYYAGLDSFATAYRIVANTAAEIPISQSQQWKLKAGVQHEFDKQPLATVEKLDTSYYLNLAYDW